MDISPGRHLPEEMLEIIVDYLRLPPAISIGEQRSPDFSTLSASDKTIKLQLCTLASLSRTCKALNRIVKPVLYHTYPGARIANARTFVKTLANDAICADSVRELIIDKWEHISGNHGSPIDRAPQSLDIQCLQYVRGLRRASSCYPMGLGSAIGAELDSGRADVVLTALTTLCDNVEVLEISVPCVDEATQREEFLRSRSAYFLLDVLPVYRWTSESHKRYLRVKKVAIRLERQSGTFGCTFATRMLLMSNVESFSAWRISCSRLLTAREAGITDYPWAGLKSIELRDCKMDNVMLAYLLQRAPNLRRVHLQWAVQQYALDFRSIAASLNTFGSKLEIVRLDTRNNFCYLHDPIWGGTSIHEACEEPLGNLEQMVSLQYLAVTPRALIGSDAYGARQHSFASSLPRNLRTLQVIGPTREDPSKACSAALMRQILSPAFEAVPLTDSQLQQIQLQCVASTIDLQDPVQWRSTIRELQGLGPEPGFHCTLTRVTGTGAGI